MTRVNQQSEQIQLEIDEVSSKLLVSLSDTYPCSLARRIGEGDVQTADLYDPERADRLSSTQKFTQGFAERALATQGKEQTILPKTFRKYSETS